MINTVGIVGGMGSYATVDFFRRIIDAFPAVKEWDRPRILIDNYCTMPSRVRAILYNERRDELVADLCSSVKNLLNAGAEKLIFACNTSHVFIPEILERIPEARDRIIHIIDFCARELRARLGGIERYLVLATEGTIETGIYQDIFSRYDIAVKAPGREDYEELRYFIEAVKQNTISAEVMDSFCRFVDGFGEDNIILGCTELPILYSECLKHGYIFSRKIHDPLQSAINVLVHLRKS